MARDFTPDPSQADWDGGGPWLAFGGGYILEPLVPVEWVSGSELITDYVFPDHVWIHAEHPELVDDEPVPDPDQLAGLSELSGDMVTIPGPDESKSSTVLLFLSTVPEAFINTAGDSENDSGWGDNYPLNAEFLSPGELWLWNILNAEPDPDPDPGNGDPDPPEPVGDIDPADVLRFAALSPTDSDALAVVTQHLPIVTAQVEGYTRGRGFTDEGNPDRPLAAVIVSATARSAVNPTGATRLSFGELRTEPGVYAGFTLPELAILNNYRRRWA